MIRKTIFAVATVVAIGAAALIPTEASAGGGGKGGFGGIVVIGPAAGVGSPASAGCTSATNPSTWLR